MRLLYRGARTRSHASPGRQDGKRLRARFARTTQLGAMGLRPTHRTEHPVGARKIAGAESCLPGSGPTSNFTRSVL